MSEIDKISNIDIDDIASINFILVDNIDKISYVTFPHGPPPPFEWNIGTTPDTIAPGGDITIEVQGGEEPYSWSIDSGTGYTLDNAVTLGLTNGLNSVAGTCGFQYSATVTITVTDNLSSSLTKVFRNTGGVWSEQCTYGTDGCGYDDNPTCIDCGQVQQYYYGAVGYDNRRWKAFGYQCRTSTGCFWGTFGSCVGMGAPIPPQCPTIYDCACPGSSCTHGGNTCIPVSLGYELWACP